MSTYYYEDGVQKIYKTAEQMKREDIEKDRNSADEMLQQAVDVMTTDDPETTNCTLMAIAHTLLAVRGELERIGDILDERMPSL